MENKEEIITMLHQIPSPAFLAEGGCIIAANFPALQLQLQEGTEIAPLLATGQEEYAQFQGGCLYLTLLVWDVPFSASVSAVGSSHLFTLEQDEESAELKALALAAQALRSPLSVVLTTSGQLDLREEEQTKDRVARMNRGLHQILRMVGNMSDAYRYRQETAFRGEIRDIGAIIDAHVELATPLLEQAGTVLRYRGLRESVFGMVDTEKLERAISNLLSNAVKFSPKGSTVDIRLRHRGKLLYLTVQDSGEGIPAQIAGNVYRRYERAPGLEDARFGLGLGLVMVRAAAAAHGGTVLMEQGEDFGLRVTMTIPIRQREDPMVRAPMIRVDYAGEWDHLLLEFADLLPPELYEEV